MRDSSALRPDVCPHVGSAELMAGGRLLRILAQLEEGTSAETASARLCEGCAYVMAMTGAGIMLMSGDVPGARSAAPTG